MHEESEPNWLTLQQAAARVGCSTKTLYRLMQRGELNYRSGTDNRRYISDAALYARFPARTADTDRTVARRSASLEEKLDAIIATLERQGRMLEQLIELYQPKTLSELAAKQAARRGCEK